MPNKITELYCTVYKYKQNLVLTLFKTMTILVNCEYVLQLFWVLFTSIMFVNFCKLICAHFVLMNMTICQYSTGNCQQCKLNCFLSNARVCFNPLLSRDFVD